MGAQKDCPALLELTPHEPVFVTGATVERLPGDCYEYVLYFERDEQGQRVRDVIARVVCPESVVAEIRIETERAMGHVPVTPTRRILPLTH